MSVLFYRRPDYLSKLDGPVNASDCARYVERAKVSERAIPPGLSFDDIMSKKTLPPCSLGDFMDYLIYVEHNAENLQFYLWYQGYVRRWNALSENEKSLSPEWLPGQDVPGLRKERDSRKEGSLPPPPVSPCAKPKVLSGGWDATGISFFDDSDTQNFGLDTSSIVTCFGGSLVPNNVEISVRAGLKWQPFTVQPNREECNHILKHYLVTGSPRELNLSYRDRALVVHSLQHTTHPSAFLPAVKTAEATLRGQSHPNFIRWSICNGNKPRVFFVRTTGVLQLFVATLTAFLLILSRVSRWYRLFVTIFFFGGFMTMIAAHRGLCILLHHSHERILQPWELPADSPPDLEHMSSIAGSERSFSDAGIVSLPPSYRTHAKDKSFEGITAITTATSSRSSSDPTHALKSPLPASSSSSTSSFHHTFGPQNSAWRTEEWVGRYERQPLVRKIFGKSVWTQDETLRILQDRIMLGANLWAAIITVPLMVAVTALPVGGFF